MRLDEALKMSARLAVASGDARWRDRYRRLAPDRDRVIGEAMELKRSLGLEPLSSKTDEANRRLVALESQALEMSSLGRLEEANRILRGEIV